MRNLGEQPGLLFQMQVSYLAIGYASSGKRQQEEILKIERKQEKERACGNLTQHTRYKFHLCFYWSNTTEITSAGNKTWLIKISSKQNITDVTVPQSGGDVPKILM